MTIARNSSPHARVRRVAIGSVSQIAVVMGILLCMVGQSPATAAMLDLTPSDQGSFSRSLNGFSFSLNESIFHNASSATVSIRNASLPGPPPLFNQNANLSAGYLIFDLPSIGTDLVDSASLELDWTGAVFNYNVNGVNSDPAMFQADYSDSGFPLFALSKFLVNDLTGGPVYASSTTPGFDNLALSVQAITDINARLGDQFVIGLFGGDGSFNTATLSSARLLLQTTPAEVPEPSSVAFVVVSLLLIGRRSRKEA